MLERKNFQKDPEKLRIISEAVVVSDPSQLRGKDQAFRLSAQVSRMIEAHNSEFPGEMLPKSPEAVYKNFIRGGSVMVVSDQYKNGTNGCNADPTVIYHGGIYELFQGELGNVVELGAAIAHTDLRYHGLGTKGADWRVYAAEAKYGQNVVCLSTVKDVRTAKPLNRGAGFEPVNYFKYPYLAQLTCSCPTSEMFGHERCVYRRLPEQSDEESLFKIINNPPENPKLPCTLMVLNPDNAEEFEERCRKKHRELSGQPVFPGEINPGTMGRIGEFFDRMRIH